VQSAHIEVVANEAEIAADGSEWEPVWRHDTELEHDKALSINEARAIGIHYKFTFERLMLRY
jgi:hypothetical protein